jgi:hypothetical protein
MDYLTSYCKNVGIIPFKTEDTPMYWIPQEYIIKTDCMEYFEIIYENDTKYKEECFEEERLCDLICTPKKKAPGIYWKPNRYFDRPYVTIDIIGTPAS